MKGPFTSQIPLLIGIEVLIVVSFVLSILALSAGNSTKYHGQSAILTLNSTQVFESSWVQILTVWVVQYLLPARHFAKQHRYRRLVRNELSISLLWDVECRCCQRLQNRKHSYVCTSTSRLYFLSGSETCQQRRFTAAGRIFIRHTTHQSPNGPPHSRQRPSWHILHLYTVRNSLLAGDWNTSSLFTARGIPG